MLNKNIWVIKDENDGGFAIYDHEGKEISALWGNASIVVDYEKMFESRMILKVDILDPNIAGSVEEMRRAIENQKNDPNTTPPDIK